MRYFSSPEERHEGHLHLLDIIIENDREIFEHSSRVVQDLANRLANGEEITAQDALEHDEFFAIRVLANRKAIDIEGIYPTKNELDIALEKHADYVLDEAEYLPF